MNDSSAIRKSFLNPQKPSWFNLFSRTFGTESVIDWFVPRRRRHIQLSYEYDSYNWQDYVWLWLFLCKIFVENIIFGVSYSRNGCQAEAESQLLLHYYSKPHHAHRYIWITLIWHAHMHTHIYIHTHKHRIWHEHKSHVNLGKELLLAQEPQFDQACFIA